MAFNFYFSTAFDFNDIDGFHLLQDHVGTIHSRPWDDYNYIVTFQIHRVMAGKRDFFGTVKVLARGWNDTAEYFKQSKSRVGSSYYITDLLRQDSVVSLGSDMDYYRRIRETLGTNARNYLQAIRDGSFYYAEFENYRRWPGFSDSLFRSSSIAQALLAKGWPIANGMYEMKSQFSFTVNFQPDKFEPIAFNFDNERSLGKTNINMLIGKNGTGKSFILCHLADIITGAVESNQSWPFFHKVIVAAFSPFESFKTKSQLYEEPSLASKQSNIPERRRLLVNHYAYIGFKDVNGKFSLEWPKECSANSLVKILNYDSENYWWKGNWRFATLFNTLRQSIDFDAMALTTVDGELIVFSADETSNRLDYSQEINSTFEFKKGIKFLKNGVPVSLSSGQIIYSYLLPSLVAEIDKESLIILDEPELYLHPTMEIGLINMLKFLLEETKSNAIIASHSSILAREVERAGIVILRREGDRTIVSKPGFQTFGQSIEVIMGEAFDDYLVSKPYEASLEKVAENSASIQDALSKIGPNIGDEALAYLAAKFTDDHDIQIERRSE